MLVFIRGEYVSVYKGGGGGVCQCSFLRGYLSVFRPNLNKLRPWSSKGDISFPTCPYLSLKYSHPNRQNQTQEYYILQHYKKLLAYISGFTPDDLSILMQYILEFTFFSAQC